MTPEQREQYLSRPDRPWDSSRPNPCATVRTALQEMCDHGAREVKAGRYKAVKLDLFNEAEDEFVRSYMATQHPGVAYVTSWMIFK